MRRGLVKSFFNDGRKESYPNAKNFTSHTHTFNKTIEGLRERLKVMQNAADKGWCMLKGELDGELVKEPRGGRTKKSRVNHSLILDIDGLPINTADIYGFAECELRDAEEAKNERKGLSFIDAAKTTIGRNQLIAMAEYIIQKLPQDFQGVSYFIHTSSSMGLYGKNRLSMHLEFILSDPVEPDKQRDWLMLQNLVLEPFKSNLTLNVTGLALKYPLDVTVASNAKLIFIGHPYFETEANNPIARKNRIMLVEKQRVLLDASILKTPINPAMLSGLKEKTIKELRKNMGLPTVKANIKRVMRDGQRIEILNNPDQMSIEIFDDGGPESEFVLCNINGGDSHGYFFLKSDPTFMRNFKDEPIFKIKDANPDFYEEIIVKYADNISAKGGRKYLVFRDHTSEGKITAVELDPNAKKVYQHTTFSDLKAATDWAAQYGEVLPDMLPFVTVEYNPTVDYVLDRRKPTQGAQEETYINTYRECDLWLNQTERMENINYETSLDVLENLCPTTYKLMLHVLNGKDELRHFLNWLAFVRQFKRKPGTTWLIHGTQGTGKGYMWENIIQPLFGEHNSKKTTIDELEDKFDAQFARKTIILIDEFRHSEAQGSKRLESKLKLMATEQNYSLRAMHKEYKEADTYYNMLFYANALDAARVDNGDRRWNIANRQERPLWMMLCEWKGIERATAMTEIGNMKNAISDELNQLAAFFKSFEVDMAQARICLNNEAKSKVAVASRTKGEDFISAFMQNDVIWMLRSGAGYFGQDSMIIQAFREGVNNMRRSYNPNKGTVLLTTKMLAAVRAAVEGKQMGSEMDLLKFLQRQTHISQPVPLSQFVQGANPAERGFVMYCDMTTELWTLMGQLLNDNQPMPEKPQKGNRASAQ